MRGAVMSLTAASSGFVILLLTVSVIQGFGVNYTDTHICSSKGSTVKTSCTYSYPSSYGRVKKRFWFSKGMYDNAVDLTTNSDYKGRVENHCDERKQSCTLTITDLRESDSVRYRFRFTTNHKDGKYTGKPGVTLSVRDPDLQVLVERSSDQVELKCHSSFNAADGRSFVWYKNQLKMEEETFSIRVSVNDDNRYSCALKGCEDHRSPPVYAPQTPTLSVSPSAEIVEGSSVTLTCSSDANPAANYTWYKKDKKRLSDQSQFVFSSIQPSDSGQYYCVARNDLGIWTSATISIDVKYAPKPPSVSVNPPGEIMEGSSVNLTCSSDANPAANYTWYKEDEDSPKASGQIFTITDLRPEHSGNYYCEAQNTIGRQKSTLNLTVVISGAWKFIAVTVSVVVLVILLFSVFLWIIKKRRSEAGEKPDDREQIEPSEEQDGLHYASVHFSRDHSSIRSAQARRHNKMKEQEDVVVYDAVAFNQRASPAPRTRGQEASEDPAALYSSVNKPLRKH